MSADESMTFSPKKKKISTNVKRLLFASILHPPGTNAITTYTSLELCPSQKLENEDSRVISALLHELHHDEIRSTEDVLVYALVGVSPVVAANGSHSAEVQ